MSSSQTTSTFVDASEHSCRRLGETRLRLAILPIGAIDPHEIYTPRHENRLAQRIDGDGFLANPIIAAEVNPGQYTLIDGTHRLEYLRAHGFAHALAQIVDLRDRERVTITTWHHGVTLVDEGALREAVVRSGLSLADVDERDAQRMLMTGAAVATLAFTTGTTVVVHPNGTSWPDALHRIVGLYGDHERIADIDGHPSGPASSPSALVVSFAPVTPAAIETLARTNTRIPAGISRALLLGGRVLGANIPLELLRSDASSEAQDRYLDAVRQAPLRWFANGGSLLEPTRRDYQEPLAVLDPSVAVSPLLC